MKIREAIGKIPVWKAVVVLVLIISFLIIGIEEIFLSKVFRLFDRSINHFEKVFQEEDKEIDDDYERFNQSQEYDALQSKINSDFMSESATDSPQVYNCKRKKRLKKLEKLLTLPYTQNNEGARDGTIKQIELVKEYMAEAVAQGKFDPTKCQEEELK